ncbi:lysophospholipid acyltransferase family protein [Dyadobacter luticola]|uniref:Lysophospholipid acyltransferase family protein n=1 Tax=Dyadobacter luticola TaxID=1979387 RepID=A0A5R9L5C1_9BACT|nr:lysophospholipid acyltransferase family protein [Dyadobacter luticola]TLV03766.1 lysophospholipid acyltransferase family protein [Dyadobacter luticola]
MRTIRFRLALFGWRSVADLIYLIFRNLWPYRQQLILKNLADCFPVFSEGEIKALSTRYFRHLADLIVEPFLVHQLPTSSLGKLTTYDNLPLLRQLIAEKKDIVLMASHYGNWEYLLSLPLMADCNVLAAYSPLSNRFLDRVLRKFRGRYGVQLVPKSEWYRTVLKWQSDKPSIFITIADQRPGSIAKNHVEFMNLKTFVQPGAARIAANRNCAVIYLDVQKKARNSYHFSFEPLVSESLNLNEKHLMKTYFNALEMTIRRQPELWLWSHNRWKYCKAQK